MAVKKMKAPSLKLIKMKVLSLRAFRNHKGVRTEQKTQVSL